MEKCLQTQNNVIKNSLQFLTAYFAKLKIKLVHLLKTEPLKLQDCIRKLAMDTKITLFSQVFLLETE